MAMADSDEGICRDSRKKLPQSIEIHEKKDELLEVNTSFTTEKMKVQLEDSSDQVQVQRMREVQLEDSSDQVQVQRMREETLPLDNAWSSTLEESQEMFDTQQASLGQSSSVSFGSNANRLEAPREALNAFLDLSGSVEVSENQKRWSIAAMCSFRILPPVIRSYITPVLHTLYKDLKADHEVHIDEQSYPAQYKSHGGVFLNYEQINRNKSNNGRRYDKYDYSVRNAVDLSKLFVNTAVCSYTDFKECDLSTLLLIINKINRFHPTVRTWAEEVRVKVRHAICHAPDFSNWDKSMFESVFVLIKGLVKSFHLPNSEAVLNDIDKWEKRADLGKNVELEIKALAECVLNAKLQEIEMSIDERFKRLEQMVEEKTIEKLSVIYSRISNWGKDETEFVKTASSSKILDKIRERSCVTITGSFGTGKTCTMRYVAEQMRKEDYVIVPITEPFELKYIFRPDQKTLFVIDDFCGIYSLNKTVVDCWKQYSSFIEDLLKSSKVKIIAACRLQVYRDKHFRPLPLSHECNLSEKEYHLTESDAKEIASLYLKDENQLASIAHYYSHYSCFPLLCKHINAQTLDLTSVFESHLQDIYEGELKKINDEHDYSKTYTLALCVIFNNKISARLDLHNINTNIQGVLIKTSQACLFRVGIHDLVQSLHDECNTLYHTFLDKANDTYMAMNQKLFNSLVKFYMNLVPECVITTGSIDLINSKFQLMISSWDSYLQHTDNEHFLIQPKYHSIYFERLLKELLNGNFHEVLKNYNSFQSHFMRSIMDVAYSKDNNLLEQLARTVDISAQDTFLSVCCMMPEWQGRSGKNIISWCLEMGINVNQPNSSGKTPLFVASQLGNIIAVDILLTNNANVDKSDNDGFSPLYAATQYGHTAIVERLLYYNANVNQCNSIGSFPLAVACQNHRLEIFKSLLERGAEIDKQMNDGTTSLSIACQYGCNEIVQQLVDLGACVNSVNDNRQSPLLYACSSGFQQIIKILIENNANVNLCNNHGTSPLHVLTHAKQGDRIAMAKFLLENNADVNATDHRNLSILYDSCQSGYFEMVKLLLDFGADVNLRCFVSGTPLYAACIFGFKKIVEILLEHKADVNIYDQINMSPLHVACRGDHTSIVEQLLRKNPKIDEVDDESDSPLSIACYNGNIEIVKLLLDYKADVNNNKSISPLVFASQNGHKAIVNLLLDNDVEINSCNIGNATALYLACQNGFTEIVKILLGHNAVVNICYVDGSSPLFVACQYERTSEVKLLLEKKADVEAGPKDQWPLLSSCEKGFFHITEMLLLHGASVNRMQSNGTTALFTACIKNRIQFVELLLRYKADVNICLSSSSNPLIFACGLAHAGIVKLLLENKANVNASLITGETPLHFACLSNSTEIANMLVQKGVSINKASISGQTPLHMASANGNADIVKLLLDNEAFVDCRVTGGETPLIIACKNNHLSTAKMLLEHNADLNARDENGISAINVAYHLEFNELVRLLLEYHPT